MYFKLSLLILLGIPQIGYSQDDYQHMLQMQQMQMNLMQQQMMLQGIQLPRDQPVMQEMGRLPEYGTPNNPMPVYIVPNPGFMGGNRFNDD